MENDMELIRKEADGGLSFGDYLLAEKKKVSDFEYCGDLYKVKSYYEITKLEKNGMFVYESVPGSTVTGLKMSDKLVEFFVEAKEDVQITMELEAEKDYSVLVDGNDIGEMRTNVSGKLVFSIELENAKKSEVRIIKL